ncbi:MAG TPA: hypothetical protein VM639_21045 [Dongiaceae bacterium]|nr:hypothetical protein [Dongiaceae bacterium]
MLYIRLLGIAAGLLLINASVFSSEAGAKVDQTIRAFSVWHADSQLAAGEAGTHGFTGTVSGPFYVDTEKGPVNSGAISCKAKLMIKDADKTQQGEADCIITVKDGATVQGKISCHGVFQVGCSGKIELIDGTGRLRGIEGGGSVVIRSDFADLQSQGIANPASLQSGLMYFPAMRYQLP